MDSKDTRDSQGTVPEFLAEFLDDFFAECDEHLATARRDLLSLDPYEHRFVEDQTVIHALLRSFHTLKGLTSMAGIDRAEQVAHQLEGYLRLLRDRIVVLESAGLDALADGVNTLEAVLSAYRSQQPLPDVTPLLIRLQQLWPGQAEHHAGSSSISASLAETAPVATLSLKPEERVRLESVLNSGAQAWRFEFTPSQLLAERGVNVNEIRQRLQGIGEIIQASPVVTADGGVKFTFLVVSQSDESAFAPWAADGIAYEMFVPGEETVAERDAAVFTSAPDDSFASLALKVVRVELNRLDDLMQMLGNLVISRARLEDNIGRLKSTGATGSLLKELEETHSAMGRQLRDLREAMMRMRLVRIGETFERMQFVVRDLVRKTPKRVRIELSGQDTDIDKFVVERMMDPLLHLVRNAVSHGLETAAERTAAGKPPEGRLSLRAYTAGEMVVVEIEDDGRGLDTEQIATKAHTLGLIDTRAEIDEAKLLDVICAPGFSTREEADLGSGRGMGMAIVRNTIRELNGTLRLRTERGQGARFTIRLPLTLAIVDALIVRVGMQTFAVPRQAVREVLELGPLVTTAVGEVEVAAHRGQALPLLPLNQFFGLAGERGDFVLVIDDGLGAIGAIVDRIVGLREIVVQAITDPLGKTTGIAGATELGEGRPVLILDTGGIAAHARQVNQDNGNGDDNLGLDALRMRITRWGG